MTELAKLLEKGKRKLFHIEMKPRDITTAICGNRRQCVVAHTIDRVFGLRGAGHVKVDVSGIAFTLRGTRYTFHTPSSARELLIKFDTLGEAFGQEIARQQTDPINFNIRLLSSLAIPPKASPERKAQINAARNARNQSRRERGLPIYTSRRRFVGV